VGWYLFTGLDSILNGSDIGSVCERSKLSNGVLSLSQQTTTVTSSLPHAWLNSHEAVVQSSGVQSNVGQHQLTAARRQICSSLLTSTAKPVSSAVAHWQLASPGSGHPETATVAVPSSSQPAAALSRLLSSGSSSSTSLHPAGQHGSRATEVQLEPAETSAVESSCADARRRRRASSVLEMGNVHLRDLLCQDDDDDAAEPNAKSSSAYQSHDSPQEPQSTSCDDPPDSSTGSIRSNVSILKQLLADSDSEEQNEVSTCEPESTHNESHVLLKVC